MGIKIGMELEFHLLDENGKVVNRAGDVLSHKYNGGNIIKELSKSMVEVIAPPSDNLDLVKENFKKELLNLKQITNDLNLYVMPSSSIGNDVEIISNDSERERGMKKRLILGDYLRDLEHHICGTHIHVDRCKDKNKLFNQYLLMQAMDPLFSLMSSTPFFRGQNSKKDYRVDVYRNVVFENHSVQGQLSPYPKSLEEVFERQEDCYEKWTATLKEKGLNSEGFDELSCLWGPLRMCKNTIESRCADSNKLSNLMALASLYKGISEIIEKEDLEVDVNGGYIPNLFKIKDGRITLPSYGQLKYFEAIGVKEGLSNLSLRTYLSNVIETCEKGLENTKYLEPFKNYLKTSSNFASEIVTFALDKGYEKDGVIVGDGANGVRLYIANEYDKDLIA